MYALRADTACTVTALLLPTFGKRSQAQASTARKRSTTASHATEQTEAAAMSPTTHKGDDQENHETEHNTGSTQEQTSTPSINSLEDVISIIGQHSREGEAYRTLHLDAEKLRNAKQNELRTLCKPWGVTIHAKNAQGLYSKRGDEELKLDIRNQMIQRAEELQRQRSTATHRPATELANAEFDFEGAVAEVMNDFDANWNGSLQRRLEELTAGGNADPMCRTPSVKWRKMMSAKPASSQTAPRAPYARGVGSTHSSLALSRPPAFPDAHQPDDDGILGAERAGGCYE